jgi:hypothetical protein
LAHYLQPQGLVVAVALEAQLGQVLLLDLGGLAVVALDGFQALV